MEVQDHEVITDAPEAPDTLAWLSRIEIIILARQHEYIKRILELQLEAALPEVDRCPSRAARLRTAARAALDEIRRHLGALHDAVGQLPPQMQRADSVRTAALSLRGDTSVAAQLVKSLPAVSVSAAAGDCPICLRDLAAPPEEHCHCSGDCACDQSDITAASVVALPCGRGAHRFHRHCIQNWAMLSAKCPLCREEITTISVKCMSVSNGASPQALTPPAPAHPSSRRSEAVEMEMSRLRSQSEGPRSRGASSQLTQELGTLGAANSTPRAALGVSPASNQRSTAPPDAPNAVVVAAASGYGRALASAAVASAQRFARAAVPSTPSLSTASTAPSTPSLRPSRRHSRDEPLLSEGFLRLRGVPPSIGASVQSGSSNRNSARRNVNHVSRAANPDALARPDILDGAAAVSSHRAASEPERDVAAPEEFPPRLRASSEGQATAAQHAGASIPLRPSLGIRIATNAVQRSSSPLPPRSVRSSSSSGALSTPSTARSASIVRSPSAAAIATAASGYGRALAAAAVASSLRLAAARPPVPAEDGGHANMQINSRSFLHGSVAMGSHSSVLARAGRELMLGAAPLMARRSSDSGSEPAEGSSSEHGRYGEHRTPSR